MYLASFRHLIEIEALKGQNQNDSSHIFTENKRISDLESLREKVAQEIKNLEEEKHAMKLTEKQLEIESLDSKIKKMKSQLEMVTNEKEQHALENQIALLQGESNTKEEIYFSLLERLEKIDDEKKDHQEFLKGSISSLLEIKNEVEVANKKYQEQIDNRNKRVNSLLDQCLPTVVTYYLEIEKKFTPKRPVAYLIDKKCSQCHMQQDSTLRLSLEEGRSLETCPTCGRLLIPETAKIY